MLKQESRSESVVLLEEQLGRVIYAFRNVLSMSPVAYLSRLRLHQVRKSLKEAKRQSTTVTAEALHWGFWHVGDFSKAYKECFDELPSETLAREP